MLIIYGYSYDSEAMKRLLELKNLRPAQKSQKPSFDEEIRFRGASVDEKFIVFESRSSLDTSAMNFIVMDVENKTRFIFRRTLSRVDRKAFLSYLENRFRYGESQSLKETFLQAQERQLKWEENEKIVTLKWEINKKSDILYELTAYEEDELNNRYLLGKLPISYGQALTNVFLAGVRHGEQSQARLLRVRSYLQGSSSYKDEVFLLTRAGIERQAVFSEDNYSLSRGQEGIEVMKDQIYFRGTLDLEREKHYYLNGSVE